jgi:fumarate hydratase class I
MVNEGVRRAYNHPDNKLRASVLADPAGKRKNTQGQHAGRGHEIVPGDTSR